MERDYIILNMIYRFGFCFGRHVAFLANFPSARTCDRRLKLLVDNGYLFRKKVLYGLPYLYYLTKDHQGLLQGTITESKKRSFRKFSKGGRKENLRKLETVLRDPSFSSCLFYIIY